MSSCLAVPDNDVQVVKVFEFAGVEFETVGEECGTVDKEFVVVDQSFAVFEASVVHDHHCDMSGPAGAGDCNRDEAGTKISSKIETQMDKIAYFTEKSIVCHTNILWSIFVMPPELDIGV
jgi:hypothetical protein